MKNEEVKSPTGDYVLSTKETQELDPKTGKKLVTTFETVYRPSQLEVDEAESTFMF